MLPQTSPAPPVRITALCDAEKNKSVEVDEPIMLRCEISDPNAQVKWYKDGITLREAAGQDMLAEGSIRTLAFQSAMPSHAGIYSCKTTDDAMQFHVDVKGDTSYYLLCKYILFRDKCIQKKSITLDEYNQPSLRNRPPATIKTLLLCAVCTPSSQNTNVIITLLR